MSLIEKSPKVQEYLKWKGKMTVPAFVDILGTVSSIKVTPHAGQWEIINAYEERIPAREEYAEMGMEFEYKYRTLVAACGRRFGKSVIASVLGAQELLVPNARVLICSYTLDNAGVIFKHIRSIIKGLGIELSIDRYRDMELELKDNGSTLRVASVDNVESKLGTSVSLLILDEAKLFQKSLYEQVLYPMLFDMAPYSRTLLISSPQSGWFEGYYKRGLDPTYPDVWSINLPTHTNPTIPRSELAAMEKSMPVDLYEQEVLGLFTSAAGLVCREFDSVEGVFNADEPFLDESGNEYYLDHLLHEGNLIFHSIDSGYTHYFGSLHFVDIPNLDHILIINEYQRNKALTSAHAEAIKDYETEQGIEVTMRYADPAASQQIADFAEHDLYFNRSEKNLIDTIITLNTLMYQRSSVTGRPKLLVNSTCTELIRQFNSVQWKEGQDALTREKSATGVKPFRPDLDKKTDWDLFDTARYGLYSYVKCNQASISIFAIDAGPDDEDEPGERTRLAEEGWIKETEF